MNTLLFAGLDGLILGAGLGLRIWTPYQKLAMTSLFLGFWPMLWLHDLPTPLQLLVWGIGLGMGVLTLMQQRDLFYLPPPSSASPSERRSDIRELMQPVHAPAFNPSSYFNATLGCFMGLGKNGPCYQPYPLPHIQICGSTGSGKSAFMGVLAAQCMLAGEAVAYFDPKHDVWASSVLKTAAAHARCSFHVLDLRPEAPPQFNLIDGASTHELEELLIAGLELHDLGNEADHYRLADRQAAYRTAHAWHCGDTLHTLYAREGQRLQRQAPGFAGKLRELARLPAAQAQHGLHLPSWLEQGGTLYILGSTRHDAVKRLQRMVLLRLLQLAEHRHQEQTRTMALLLDEFKYHLCRSSLDALGTARDKNVHMVLAHQSLGDLAAGPLNMDAQAVAAIVAENCTLKMIYRLQDPDTAHWMSRRSGQQRIYENSWTYRPHDLLDRVALREATGPYVDENTLLSLPWGSAMLFGSKLPMEVRISPYPTLHHRIKVDAAEGTHETLDFTHLKQRHHA